MRQTNDRPSSGTGSSLIISSSNISDICPIEINNVLKLGYAIPFATPVPKCAATQIENKYTKESSVL